MLLNNEVLKIERIDLDGVIYYRLYSQCPVCLDRAHDTPVDLWTHQKDECEGDIYIGNNAYLMCSECHENCPIIEVSFGCPDHSNITKTVVSFDNGKKPW